MNKRQLKKQQRAMSTNNEGVGNFIGARAKWASLQGMQFGGDRNLNQVLGYKVALTSRDMNAMYKRGDIAKTIVNAYPDACFRHAPEIYEDEEEDVTDFEQAVIDLDQKRHLWHYCQRADRMAGIGRFSLLVFGFNDGGKNMDKPVGRATELLWLMPVPEYNIQIAQWDKDISSENYGKPLTYRVTTGADDAEMGQRNILVHYSRCVHIAEDCDQNDVYGSPSLEAVFNRLFDIQKIAGGSAEMFWLGARNGLQFKANEGATLGEDDVTAIRSMADEFQHQIRRLLTARNGEWSAMESQVADPRGNFDVQIDLISAASRIPKRILLGNEAGELGSSQDETNWSARVEERRQLFVIPFIVRKVIDLLIKVGVLPTPKEDGTYEVEFAKPPMSQVDEATIANTRAQAIATYANSSAAQMIVPPQEFREEVLKLPPESVYELPDEVDDTDGNLDPGTAEGSDPNADDPQEVGGGNKPPVPPTQKANQPGAK